MTARRLAYAAALLVPCGLVVESGAPLAAHYRQYTWHTNRDTYDKIVFDDLRNNATLAAMLAYAASEDPERMDVTRRVMPVSERTGQPGTWPQCRPPRRSSGR